MYRRLITIAIGNFAANVSISVIEVEDFLRVRVKFFASARDIVGTREEVLDIQDSARVIDLLTLLAKKHGEKLKEYLFDTKTGNPRSYLQFLVNDRPITGDFSTPLMNDCVLMIFPPAGGG